MDLGRRLLLAVVVVALEDDLDEPPALGVFSASPAAAFFASGETLSAELGIGELARLGTASAFVGTDDTVPSAAASDMVVCVG